MTRRVHRVVALASALSVALAGAAGGISRAGALPTSSAVPGSSVKYTTDADFDKGLLVNVNHDAPNSNQLQLNKGAGTFPFIWIALSQRETIAKVDTRTGAILGEYKAVSDGAGTFETSRTTVMTDGSVWVGHRYISQITHIGLKEANQCVDRNNDGLIQTSSGYDDILAWPGGGYGATGPVTDAVDECILATVDTPGGDSRHMSVDATGMLWVGDYGSHTLVKVDPVSASIVSGTQRSFGCGGYGGFIDSNGVIWSANGGGTGLLRWDPNAPDSAVAPLNPQCISIPVYGLAVDRGGNVWASQYGSPSVTKLDASGTILGTYSQGGHGAQGLAADSNGDIWISSSLSGGPNQIAHLKNDGTFVGNVTTDSLSGIDGGDGSTGVAVDSNGKIWVANRNSNNAARIDPNAGAIGADGVTHIGAFDLSVPFPTTSNGTSAPYNYSDMTGSVALGSTAPQGSWTVVQDAGQAGFDWATVIINTEPQGRIPAGSSIAATIEARGADSEAGLGGVSYQTFSNCGSVDVKGRFIQVRLTLKPNAESESPILSDVTIRGGPPPTTADCAGKRTGYALLTNEGGWFAYGEIEFLGSASVTGPSGRTYNDEFVNAAMTPTQKGYWAVSWDGGVFAHGDAGFYGSAANLPLNAPIVAIAATPTGKGYWLAAADGGVFSFGDATFFGSAGSLPLNEPILGMAATPTGRGYWLVAADGGVFAFGDAVFAGSMGGTPLNEPIMGMAASPAGGYWLVASDGGVFAFGGAPFLGSMGGKPLVDAVVAIASSTSGAGYVLAAEDGGTFTFGDMPFKGSAANLDLNGYVVAVVTV